MSVEDAIEDAPVAAGAAASIPTLDLRRLEPAELAQACRDWGLFHVVGHGVPEPELGPSGLGIHHHTDAGALTVLLQDEVSGLQVYRESRWYEATPVAGALTVNIGDLAQVWSNDRYPAPIHRVRAMTAADRYTAAFFFNPGYAATIAPQVGDAPAYRPFRWGEFRAGRAEGDFANYGTEVQIADYRA